MREQTDILVWALRVGTRENERKRMMVNKKIVLHLSLIYQQGSLTSLNRAFSSGVDIGPCNLTWVCVPSPIWTQYSHLWISSLLYFLFCLPPKSSRCKQLDYAQFLDAYNGWKLCCTLGSCTIFSHCEWLKAHC